MKSAIVISLLLCLNKTIYSQDSLVLKLDTAYSKFSVVALIESFQPSYDFINHSVDPVDEEFYKENKHLIGQPFTEKNHSKYYRMACALWDLEKIRESEKMFLNIYKSNIGSVTSTYHSNSDIPGDTTTNIYGYGSLSSHYKNDVCIYLCKIYIKQKNFGQALFFLDKAVNKYKTTYNCGTGYNNQKNKYNSLYAICYEGLGQNQKVLDLLTHVCLEWNCKSLIASIRKLYSKNGITDQLLLAERSIKCEMDTFESESYQYTNCGKANEKIDTIRYYGGTGTIILFGKKIDLPYPRLENGERLTREYYVTLFKKSSFYRTLSNKNNL